MANTDSDDFLPFSPSADICMARAIGLVRPSDRVLEMGCGLGDDALYLATAGCEVTALDTSWIAIRYAKSLVRTFPRRMNILFQRGNDRTVARFAREGRHFDFFSDRLVLSNLDGVSLVTAYIANIAMLLKPRGILFLRYGYAGEKITGKPLALAPLMKIGMPREQQTGSAALRALRAHFEPLVLTRDGGSGKSLTHKASPTYVPMLPHRGGNHPEAVVTLWTPLQGARRTRRSGA
jgi:SAM-dependent methyltransferase